MLQLNDADKRRMLSLFEQYAETMIANRVPILPEVEGSAAVTPRPSPVPRPAPSTNLIREREDDDGGSSAPAAQRPRYPEGEFDFEK